ncbi:hypothetical protein FGO68_gene772 [Halteria grandinella]|uniref:Uncharacterized protein n=1 Tax=Halteria grandinella TaxID=5974 RepID=A0A8J8NT36_HALGN|nr:hypothetical protein FGO68_gene772 [Halteria grandinella]
MDLSQSKRIIFKGCILSIGQSGKKLDPMIEKREDKPDHSNVIVKSLLTYLQLSIIQQQQNCAKSIDKVQCQNIYPVKDNKFGPIVLLSLAKEVPSIDLELVFAELNKKVVSDKRQLIEYQQITNEISNLTQELNRSTSNNSQLPSSYHSHLTTRLKLAKYKRELHNAQSTLLIAIIILPLVKSSDQIKMTLECIYRKIRMRDQAQKEVNQCVREQREEEKHYKEEQLKRSRDERCEREVNFFTNHSKGLRKIQKEGQIIELEL